jgi:glycosyltransferase involved in cell wall biosynthesis
MVHNILFDNMMNSRSLKVSVVIPAFNEEKGLETCVRRIREACNASADIANAYEIIVCDNNSTDTTAAVAAAGGCKVVCEPINPISKARNRGASVATGEWLLFVDADSWPSPELIADIAPLLGSTEYIGCGSTIRVVDGPWWFKFTWKSKNWSMRTFKWCPGGFIFCRRDAFTEIGGFPEEYYIFEELEFVKRLRRLASKRGQRFTILHKHPFSTSGRKGLKHSLSSWLKFGVRFCLSPRKLVRDKTFAARWYEVDR